MKVRAASFYQAFCRLPKDRFMGVAAVYAFCRYADDTVDRGGPRGDTALRTLDLLEDRLRSAYTGVRSSGSVSSSAPDLDTWWPAFEDAIRRFDIPIDGFLNQIAGQRMDAEFRDIRTVAELIEYSRLVAGSVGIMMLPLLTDGAADRANPDFIKDCERLGIGMQITNILRDVGEDLRTRNRLYLPRDWLDEYGVERSDLERLSNEAAGARVDDRIPEGFIRLWERLAGLADTYYGGYEKWLSSFHESCRVPLVAAALIYRAIADAVRMESYNCFTKRCYTSPGKRVSLVREAGEKMANGDKPEIAQVPQDSGIQ